MKRKIFFITFLAAIFMGLVTIANRSGQAATDRLDLSNAQIEVEGSFTYQGQLTNADSNVQGTCDFRFGLWDDSSAGSQLGNTQIQVGMFNLMIRRLYVIWSDRWW